MDIYLDKHEIAKELIRIYKWLDQGTSELNKKIFRKRVDELERRLNGVVNLGWYKE